MKKKLIIALILTLTSVGKTYAVVEETPELKKADEILNEVVNDVLNDNKTAQPKKNIFSGIFQDKNTDELENTKYAEVPEKVENISKEADIFSSGTPVKETTAQVETKSVNQVKEDFDNLGFFEKKRTKREINNMTIHERQKELAEKVNSNQLDNSVLDSTVLQGGVEENVLVSIDDCVKLALINNPTIRYAISNSDIYKSKIAQAWSAYFPQFSLGTAYSRNKMLPTNFKFPQMKYNLWNAFAVEGSMLLYDFGKTQQQAKMARRTHEATLSDLQTAINDTVYNVKAAYYQYLYTHRQLQVLQSTVDKFNKHYLEAKAAYDVGVKSKIDVVTAEYNLSNAKLDLIKAKNQIEAAKAQLNNTMGLPTYSNYSVTDNLDMTDYALDFETLLSTAYDLRPELQSVAKRAEASRVMVTSSKLAFTPDLRGFGNYTVGGKHYAAEYGYQAGIRLSYPTSNFFLLSQQVKEAKATHERDMAELERKQNDVYLDVKTAYIDYVNSRDSVPVAHKAMNEAKMQYEIAAGRYSTGLSDAIELKDAEITYRNAQLNYYNSLMSYNTAVASVERMVGAPIQPITAETESQVDGSISEPVVEEIKQEESL